MGWILAQRSAKRRPQWSCREDRSMGQAPPNRWSACLQMRREPPQHRLAVRQSLPLAATGSLNYQSYVRSVANQGDLLRCLAQSDKKCVESVRKLLLKLTAFERPYEIGQPWKQ